MSEIKLRKVIWIILILVMLPNLCFSGQLDNFSLEEDSWFFDNFKDAELSWDIFRNSFIGIPPTNDPYSSAFDHLFYEHVFKNKLADKGNCYGLCVFNLMIIERGGYLGCCPPVSQYSGDLVGVPRNEPTGPSDNYVRSAINQMHGHQVNLPSIQFMMEIIGQGNSRDGKYAYDQFHYYLNKDDPVVISITKSLDPQDGGHTMLPYRAVQSSGKFKIYVYDPNRPWHDSFYDIFYGGENFIEIESDGSWKFYMTSYNTTTQVESTTLWSGSPSSGGHIIVCPISIAGPTTRVPTSIGDPLGFVQTFFITGQDAHITQIKDQDGKRMYIPGTREIDIQESTGMKNMMPIFISDQGGSSDNEVYFRLGNPVRKMDLELVTDTAGYQLGLIGKNSYISISAQGGHGNELVTFEYGGTPQQSLILRNNSASTVYDIEFHHIIIPNKKSKIYKIRNLKFSEENKPIIIGFENRQKMIEISTTDAGVVFDLELTNVIDRKAVTIEKKNFSVLKNQRQSIKPNNWNKLKVNDLKIKTDSFKINPNRLKTIKR